ncbi:MAG: twin-arginine translocase TatA/TatE family subunit [Caulobacter sp.]|nr:twin-arginine translocase TatA/TatE family subunit [Caulobacter sp.]
MGGMSWIHWAIVIGVAALLFGGRGKLSSLMGDAAKGIKAFQDGLKGESEPEVEEEPVPAKPLPRAKAAPKAASKAAPKRATAKKDQIVS